MSLNEIAFEYIDKEKKYAYGMYGEFKVIIMTQNGYINAAKLVSQASTKGGKPKQFKDWLSSIDNQNFIIETEAVAGIPATGIIIQVRTGSSNLTETRGTYVHPLLVPHIASWTSPKFAVKVSKIVNEYVLREHKDKIVIQEASLKEKDYFISRLEKKIDEQNMKMDNLTIQNCEQSKRIEKLLNYGQKTLTKLENSEKEG